MSALMHVMHNSLVRFMPALCMSRKGSRTLTQSLSFFSFSSFLIFTSSFPTVFSLILSHSTPRPHPSRF